MLSARLCPLTVQMNGIVLKASSPNEKVPGFKRVRPGVLPLTTLAIEGT